MIYVQRLISVGRKSGCQVSMADVVLSLTNALSTLSFASVSSYDSENAETLRPWCVSLIARL